MKNLLSLAAALCAATALTACGGGNSPAKVASQDATVSVNAANGNTFLTALSGQSFDYSNGVPAFGTTSATTLKLTGSGSGFQVSSGGNVATGSLSFASCHFTVGASSFTSGPLSSGNTVVVDPCDLKIALSGTATNGTPQTRQVQLILNGTTSSSAPMTVTVYENGTVFVGSQQVGTVATTPTTGGSS